jgi:uncharacterized protein YkwD
MRSHRRTRHFRKTVIAAAVITAVGIPSAAVACIERNGGAERNHSEWNPSFQRRWTKGFWSAAPTASASPTASATRSAAPTRTAPTHSASPTASAPSSARSTPPAAPTASGATALVAQLVNTERAKHGCAPLTVNAKLTKAAQAHSADMAAHRTMSHTGSDGSSPGERITAAGYAWSSYGENVAYGYGTPASVMAGWMNSPGHRANILNCSFKEIGVGLAQPGNYWTQDFGTPR